MNDQFSSLIQEKILASLEAKIPVLTPREAHVPGLRGKAMVVIGMRRLRWVGKSGHWEAKIGYDRGSGKGVLRRGGGGKGEVWIWGQDGDFWKLERKAEQTTERSGVGCGA
jgi:hypothetical protein